ncbi:DEAD/DEAH box helicase [Candidatus Atribacteria bacterium MT.SAG.1]|nr:DEAD/DEAH box helicase [Candidatus Atribacteria bacterium MT.SAG.1]
MSESMKIRNLKNYGIPSHIVNIWEKNYSRYLLPIQEDAVINYGILNCGGNDPSEARLHGASKNNLLVIAPPSSGKSFLGEMAAIAQVINLQKIIYLVPLRALADEKYRHFKNLYSHYGINIVISTRDRSEDDHNIISGDYDIAVMAYEKFNYFCLKCPRFLDIVSLVIIDEMQLINDSKWGPLLESIVDHIDRKNKDIKIIALSAFVEGQDALIKWFPGRTLISYQRPVELRKGMVRDGIFNYVTSKDKENYKKEVFFKPEAVGENCFEDYLLETVRYLVKRGESVLIFFATCAETQKWAEWLASQLESPAAICALKELNEMEETLSRDELRETLGKGIAHYNRNLSWEERNLIETYLKEGEIKVICATNIMAMGINLPFKNVIIALDKICNDEGNYPPNYRTSLTFAAIENMGGRAGILEFGRVIFLAHSLFFQTAYKNLYFKFLKDNNYNHKSNKQLLNIDNNLLTYLLRLVVTVKPKHEELKSYLKKEDKNILSGYWQFAFNKVNIDEKIEKALNILKGNRLIRMNKQGVLSSTDSGILIAAKRIKVETFLFFKSWLRFCENGDISILEILFLLALSPDGKALPIPFSQAIRDDYKKEINQYGCRKKYWNKLLHLIFKQNDEGKKLFRDKILMKKEKEETTSLEDYITFQKTNLLYDWIMGKKSVKTIEEEYGLYRGCIYRLGEGFSWLADSLSAIAESMGWEKKINKDLNKIRMLSNRLVEGVQEEGVNLALLYIPGLSRYHIRRLVGAGYGDVNSLRDASEVELGKLLPRRLVQRILGSVKEENIHQTVAKVKLIVQDEKLTAFKKVPEEIGIRDIRGGIICETCTMCNVSSSPQKMNISERQFVAASPVASLEPLLEISQRRPDRIIFEGKEFKVTTIGFSLLYLLAQHREKVVSYEEILKDLWKGEEDAIYTRINYHICKIRKNILKIMDKKEGNPKKVENIFKAIPGRGLMLNIKEEELEIN